VNKNDDKITAVAASAVTIALVSVLTACGSDPDVADKPKATTGIIVSASPTPTPEPTGPLMYGLKDKASQDGITLSLKNFSRGRSDEVGVPEDTNYVRFSVTVKNTTDDPFALENLDVTCTTPEVYDVEDGLEGTPSTHVLPGKSHAWDIACAQNEDERDFQVEISPQRDGDRTVIFSGTVE
jgi:hypothetical protein